eukprot:m.22711 g.22711  ORF g.22711 m.22711 type:complete len:99 (-) comp8885_c0_seq3:61-357(-)
MVAVYHFGIPHGPFPQQALQGYVSFWYHHRCCVVAAAVATVFVLEPRSGDAGYTLFQKDTNASSVVNPSISVPAHNKQTNTTNQSNKAFTNHFISINQ